MVSAQTRSQYYMTVFNGNGVDTAGNINPVLSESSRPIRAWTPAWATPGPTARCGSRATGANLTDTTYMTTLINTPGLNLRYFNPPRTFAVHMQLFY